MKKDYIRFIASLVFNGYDSNNVIANGKSYILKVKVVKDGRIIITEKNGYFTKHYQDYESFLRQWYLIGGNNNTVIRNQIESALKELNQ